MKLYCNDCMQAMSNMMGGIVDAVITDPPYNVSRKNNFTTMGSACRQGMDFGEWDCGYFQRIVKICGK